jgi:hypothetical protein
MGNLVQSCYFLICRKNRLYVQNNKAFQEAEAYTGEIVNEERVKIQKQEREVEFTRQIQQGMFTQFMKQYLLVEDLKKRYDVDHPILKAAMMDSSSKKQKLTDVMLRLKQQQKQLDTLSDVMGTANNIKELLTSTKNDAEKLEKVMKLEMLMSKAGVDLSLIKELDKYTNKAQRKLDRKMNYAKELKGAQADIRQEDGVELSASATDEKAEVNKEIDEMMQKYFQAMMGPVQGMDGNNGGNNQDEPLLLLRPPQPPDEECAALHSVQDVLLQIHEVPANLV